MELYDKDNPLSAEQIDQLRADEAELGRVQQLIDRCGRCGMDMRAEQAVANALQTRIAALLTEFGGRRMA